MIKVSRQLVINETEASKNTVSLDDKHTEVFEPRPELDILQASTSNIKDVPPNTIYGHNLKKLKSYNKLRKGYKLGNQKAVFLADMKAILKEFPHENHQYDDELLVEVLNIAESYFIYGNADDREKVKQDCIIELMQPYFKNDIALLFKTIGHVWNTVSKTNLFKRIVARAKNFFFGRVVK